MSTVVISTGGGAGLGAASRDAAPSASLSSSGTERELSLSGTRQYPQRVHRRQAQSQGYEPEPSHLCCQLHHDEAGEETAKSRSWIVMFVPGASDAT